MISAVKRSVNSLLRLTGSLDRPAHPLQGPRFRSVPPDFRPFYRTKLYRATSTQMTSMPTALRNRLRPKSRARTCVKIATMK